MSRTRLYELVTAEKETCNCNDRDAVNRGLRKIQSQTNASSITTKQFQYEDAKKYWEFNNISNNNKIINQHLIFVNKKNLFTLDAYIYVHVATGRVHRVS